MVVAGVVVVVVAGAEVVVVAAAVVVVTGAVVVVVSGAVVVVVAGAVVVVVAGAAVVVVVGALVVVVVGARVVVVVGGTVVVAGAFVVVVVAGATVVEAAVVVVAAGGFVVVLDAFVVGASDGDGDGVVIGELTRIGVVIALVESSSVELATRVGADGLVGAVVASEPELFRVLVTEVRPVVVGDATVADVAFVVFGGACVGAAGAVEPSVALAVGATVVWARLETMLIEFEFTLGAATTRTAEIVTGAALLVRSPVPLVGVRTPATGATVATEPVVVSKTMAAPVEKMSLASVVVDSDSAAAGGPAASAESETGCSFWRTT